MPCDFRTPRPQPGINAMMVKVYSSRCSSCNEKKTPFCHLCYCLLLPVVTSCYCMLLPVVTGRYRVVTGCYYWNKSCKVSCLMIYAYPCHSNALYCHGGSELSLKNTRCQLFQFLCYCMLLPVVRVTGCY